jgi:hypothetical protein
MFGYIKETQASLLVAQIAAHRYRDTAHLLRQFADALELGEYSKEKIIADMRKAALMQESQARKCAGEPE